MYAQGVDFISLSFGLGLVYSLIMHKLSMTKNRVRKCKLEMCWKCLLKIAFCCRYSTPLHDAVACGRQEIAKILIERGANVSIKYYHNHDDKT